MCMQQIDEADKKRELKEYTGDYKPPQKSPCICPNCGYCPHCGRGGHWTTTTVSCGSGKTTFYNVPDGKGGITTVYTTYDGKGSVEFGFGSGGTK